MFIHFTGFLLCALVIFLAGKKLAFYGDLIADLTGMGKAWIGLILMAFVTSLPELMVGISSSAIVQSADLAVGDILGSCAFNLGLLAMLDAFVPGKKPLLGNASQSHVLAAALGLILMTMAGVGLFLPEDVIVTPGIGLISISFILIYLFAIKLIYQYHKKNLPVVATVVPGEQPSLPLKPVIGWYTLYALIIIVAALFLPYFAEHIAEETGLGKTFVGTLFLAISTSLPEIAVSIAAVRAGSIDLSIGNLLGSNLFNIFILFIDDLVYTKGHILKDANDVQLISVFAVILMSAVAIIGFTYRLAQKRYLLAWDAFLIFLIYIVNIILLYKLS